MIVLCSVVVGVLPLAGCSRVPQALACRQALQCYFGIDAGLNGGVTTLSDVPGFENLSPDGGPGSVELTYGAEGACWDDRDSAIACETRCKGLLWQDCAHPYGGEGEGEAFCASACDAVNALPERLRFKKNPGEPLATLTPSPKLAALVTKSRDLAAAGVDVEGE